MNSDLLPNQYFVRQNCNPGEYVGFKILAKYRDQPGEPNMKLAATVKYAENEAHYAELLAAGIPIFWSIYGVTATGLLDCLGDFDDLKFAVLVVLKLGGKRAQLKSETVKSWRTINPI